MSCAVSSLTTSVLAPYFSSKFGAVLIKYSASHTILKFSLRFGRSCQSKDRHSPRIWSKTDAVGAQYFPIRDFR